MADKKTEGCITVPCSIVPLTRELVHDLDKLNQPFLVFGRLIPSLVNCKWTWTEELFETPYEKRYPDDETNYREFIDNPDKIVYAAYADDRCIGRIRLRRNWNKFCFIEDIEVDRRHRRMGIGRKLIDAAIGWAREGGMRGLMLETQDTNLAACRFYQRCGFELGAADTMLYRNFPDRDEIALFWYMPFD